MCCVVRILYHCGRHLHDPRLPRLAEAHVGTVTQDSQGASVPCKVSRVPHFLSNRFDVDSFSSLRDFFTMREYRVSEMENTTAALRSPESLTRRELSPKQE